MKFHFALTKILTKTLSEITKARLADEPAISEPHNVVMIPHPVLGSLTRICKSELTYSQIYLWIGSMKETPLYFYLKENPVNIISPMVKISEPRLLSLEETSEVAFKNYFGDNFLYIQKQSEDNSKLSTDALAVNESKFQSRSFHGFFSCA